MDTPHAVGISRRAMSIVTAAGLGLAGTLVLVTAQSAQAYDYSGGDKIWVCKYVRTPGSEYEVLKAGKNPIEVGAASGDINKDKKVFVGDRWVDAQAGSIIVQINGPDPGIQACPGYEPPTSGTTTTTSGTTTTTSGTTTTTSGTTTTTSGTTTTPPVTTTTTPPVTTTTTSPVKTQPPSTTPVKPPAKPKPPSQGGAVPGYGAPDTGGDGGINPVNGIIGSGLLLAAAGILARDQYRSRRKASSN